MRSMPRDGVLTPLVVLVPEAEPVVGPWRQRLHPSARSGMPAHCTLSCRFTRIYTRQRCTELLVFEPASGRTMATLDGARRWNEQRAGWTD